MENFFKNLGFSLLNIASTTIVTLVSIKLLLSNLGTVKFGIFSIITILNSLSSLFSFGLNYTLIHYLPKQGKSKESNLDIVIVLIISFSISFLLCFFLFVFAPQISLLLNVPLNVSEEVVVFIKFIAATLLFVLPTQILCAVFDSLNKNYISNIYQTVFTIAYWSTCSVISTYSSNLISIGFALVAMYLFSFIVLAVIFKKVWGSLKVEGFNEEKTRIFHKHFSVGVNYFITNIVGYLNEPLSKILVSRFIGLETVAYFDIAMRIKNQVWGLFSKITYPLMPLFSSTQDKDKLQTMILKITGLIFFLSAIMSCYVVVAGDFIIKLWLNNSSTILPVFVKVTVISYLLFSATSFPVYYYFTAENKVKNLAIIQFAGSFVNILFFFTLMHELEQYSIVISHSLSLFISMILIIFLYNRDRGNIKWGGFSKLSVSFRLVIPYLVFTAIALFGRNFMMNTAFLALYSLFFCGLTLFTVRRKMFINEFLVLPLLTDNKFVKRFILK